MKSTSLEKRFFCTAYIPLEDNYVLGKGVMYICCVMLDGCTPAMTSHYIGNTSVFHYCTCLYIHSRSGSCESSSWRTETS